MAEYVEITTGSFHNVDTIKEFNDIWVLFDDNTKMYLSTTLPSFRTYLLKKAGLTIRG